MWTLLVLAAMCMMSQVSAGWGHGGGYPGGHGGWRWGRGHGDVDSSDICEDCKRPCMVQYDDDEPQALCTCPDGYTCTEGETQTRGWGSWAHQFTMSHCVSDAAQPDHMGPPCLATKDDVTYDIGCPEGFTCSVGPVSDVSGWELTFCNYQSEDEVDTDMFSEWVCDQDDHDWRSWCESADWWSDWRGYWRRCGGWW